VGGLVERGASICAARGDATRIVLGFSAGKAYRRIFYLPEPFRVVIGRGHHQSSAEDELRRRNRACGLRA